MSRLRFRVALISALLAFAAPAAALEFSPLRLLSRLGEPLQAEVEVRADRGEQLTAQCLRLHRPATSALPVLSGLSLAYTATDDGAVLRIASSAPVTEPAAVLGIEARCGGGRAWHELAVLLGPDGNGKAAERPGEWVVAAGESPRALAHLLYPRQAATQRRFIAALATANPDAGIAADPARPLPTGSVLRMPDWRALNDDGAAAAPSQPRPRPVAAPREDVVRVGHREPRAPRPAITVAAAEGPMFLRLATTLASPPQANETLRETLRLEYRLLSQLSEQLATSLSARQAAPEAPRAVPPVSPEPPAAAAPTAPAAPVTPPPAAPAPVTEPAAVTPPPVPRQIPQVQPLPAPAEEGLDWTTIAGAIGAVLLLLIVLSRWRGKPMAAAAPVVPKKLEEAETVLADDRAPNMSPEAVEAFFAEPPKPVAPAPLAVPVIPEAPAATDVNPVIELAEIMMSFGRIHGAAQTLQEFIEANPKEALLPLMKLLDIYRAGNLHDEFDELAMKLHQNFNVELQHWDLTAPPPPRAPDIPPKARTLEEAPHICERIVSTWGKPECLEYLHQLLRDNRGGSRTGFTLPVVQELLLLIDILVARDAADNP